MMFVAIAFVGALVSAAIAIWRKPQLPGYWPVLALALLPQIANLVGLRVAGMFFWAMVAVFVWCMLNYAVSGALVVALGVGMNLLPMAWHSGYMPIRTDILAEIGQIVSPGTVLLGSKDIAVLSSPLWLLSDWIIVRLPSGPIVASPGDAVVVFGIVWWLVFSHRPEKESIDVDTLCDPHVA